MASETPQTHPAKDKPQKPLEFQSPPALSPKVSPAELEAIHGPALTHAKSLSSNSAIIAGTIGSGLASIALIAHGTPQRGAKIVASTLAGGVVSYAISNLPWGPKQTTITSAEPSTAQPHTPATQTISAPPPAPAMPAASVAAPEHAGRVDAAHTTERSA